MNKKWKSKKWCVVFVKEHIYNPYKNVDMKKERPMMIWNNSRKLGGKVIAFYCTTKYKANRPFMYQINSDNQLNKPITWVDLRKMYFVDMKDINWAKRWGDAKNQETRQKVVEFIKEFFV